MLNVLCNICAYKKNSEKKNRTEKRKLNYIDNKLINISLRAKSIRYSCVQCILSSFKGIHYRKWLGGMINVRLSVTGWMLGVISLTQYEDQKTRHVIAMNPFGIISDSYWTFFIFRPNKFHWNHVDRLQYAVKPIGHECVLWLIVWHWVNNHIIIFTRKSTLRRYKCFNISPNATIINSNSLLYFWVRYYNSMDDQLWFFICLHLLIEIRIDSFNPNGYYFPPKQLTFTNSM